MSESFRVIDGGLGVQVRMPPCNYEAERALLGAILMQNKAYEKVSEFLLPEHFGDPVNGQVFKCCATLIERGHQANPVTLKTYLENDEIVAMAGGAKYLGVLAASSVTVMNAPEYGRLIYDLFLRRKLIALAEDMANDAYDGNAETVARDIIENRISGLADLLGSQAASGMVTLAGAIASSLERHDAVDKGEIGGLSSGLRAIDQVMGLLEDGDLAIIAGRPSMGKSALALTIIYHIATFFQAEAARLKTKPQQVVFFSQEMTAGESADRIISAHAYIPAPRRRGPGALSSDDWGKLLGIQNRLANLPLQIEPRPRATLSYMRTTCRRLQRAGGVGLVVVDYLQIMGVEKGRKAEGRTQEVGYLVTGLKDLAKELGCPVIALSQLNRGVEGRDDKRPSLADLRESGEIEQAADTVAFCYRDEYYLERSEPKQKPEETGEKFHDRMVDWQSRMAAAHGKAELIVGKARHGITGTAKLDFDGARTWFDDPIEGLEPFRRGNHTAATYSALPDGRPMPPAVEGL